jgi:DUF1680 family protein
LLKRLLMKGSNGRLTRRRFNVALVSIPALSVVGRAQSPPSEPVGVEPFSTPFDFTRTPIDPAVRPFGLSEVRLGKGPFEQAREWNFAYIKRLDPDRLLHVFRVNAGLASSAAPLGGWEAPSCELRGHFVGHYLSALALGWATTGDAELRARGQLMVKALSQCQEKLNQGGYLSAFPLEYFDRLVATGKVWAPFYTLHKILAGLLDQHRHAGDALALGVALRMAQWVDDWTAARTPAQMQQVLKVEFGGMSDVLYELAAITGKDQYARVGDRFVKTSFLGPLAQNQDQLQELHANTHIPQVIAAARRYELSADSRFRNVSIFFWDTVVGSRSYITGGTSNREHWKTRANQLAVEWRASAEHQECCCAYNMLKLTRQLFGWRPQARYMDYYERVLLNHRLGTIEPETGRTMYFLSLTPGAWKPLGLETDTFWCCNGTALEEFNKLGDTIYSRDAEGVWLNLFHASRLEWAERGIGLTQETRFPLEPRTTLTIDRSPPEPWNLRVRIPGWASGARILVNGEPVAGVAAPGNYASLVRRWRKGDRVVIELPMSLRREALRDDPSIEAYLYGPIVLAGQFTKGEVPPNGDRMKAPDLAAAPIEVPILPVRGQPLDAWLAPAAGQELTWRSRGLDTPVTFRPLYESWDRYAVYFFTAIRR